MPFKSTCQRPSIIKCHRPLRLELDIALLIHRLAAIPLPPFALLRPPHVLDVSLLLRLPLPALPPPPHLLLREPRRPQPLRPEPPPPLPVAQRLQRLLPVAAGARPRGGAALVVVRPHVRRRVVARRE